MVGAVFGEVEGGVVEDADEVAEFLDFVGAFAEFVGVVEIGEVGAGEAGVGVYEGLDDLGVDFVADVGFAGEGDHVGEGSAFGDDDGRGEVVGVGVFVGDVFDEGHEEDVVFVLTGVHAAAEFVAGGPEGPVEVGFFDGHGLPELGTSGGGDGVGRAVRVGGLG